MTIRRFLRTLSILAVALAGWTGCMKWDYDFQQDFEAEGNGLFIINEGNFQYGNASLSYYDPSDGSVEREVFYRANGMKLGDVAQSMTMCDGKGWIVVNNSHVVFAIDPDTFRETGRIENLTSPRYICFVSDRKAYVSQLWDNRIFIIDPSRYEITGSITVPDMDSSIGSTEQMVRDGRWIYCCCWSHQSRVIKIDTESDKVVATVETGSQPNSLALDYKGRLWVITDGGNGVTGNEAVGGGERPVLARIDTESMTITGTFELDAQSASELQTDGDGKTLWWLADDVWSMDVDAKRLPVRPFLQSKGTIYYGLTVNPRNGDVYVADAIDYQQPGMIYRYSSEGKLMDEFYSGVTPGAFCWK